MHPMTFEEAKVIVESFSYKPGYQFKLNKPSHIQSWHLQIRGPVPSAYHPIVEYDEITGKYVAATQFLYNNSYVAYPFYSESELIHYVRQQVIDMELHEIDEFLRVKGLQIKDPHPEIPTEKKMVWTGEEIGKMAKKREDERNALLNKALLNQMELHKVDWSKIVNTNY